jgi:hypothetical protein
MKEGESNPSVMSLSSKDYLLITCFDFKDSIRPKNRLQTS